MGDDDDTKTYDVPLTGSAENENSNDVPVKEGAEDDVVIVDGKKLSEDINQADEATIDILSPAEDGEEEEEDADGEAGEGKKRKRKKKKKKEKMLLKKMKLTKQEKKIRRKERKRKKII